MTHHDFNNKQNFQRTYFFKHFEKDFDIKIFVNNGIPEEALNKCYEDISSIKREFSHFFMMRNDNEEGPNIFNVLLILTFIFSMTFSVIYIKFYQKNTILVQKILTTKYTLKTNGKKKQKNVFIFVIFFISSHQIFYENNSTLSITNSNDFIDIDQYQNSTKFIIISENIYSIPGGSFSGWHSVVSVNFGNSVSNIGSYVFSSCSNLVTIIIGESVTEIGGSAFSLCSSIKNITIPNSVTTIGGSAFSSCSNLIILILGYGIREIGGSAFSLCSSIKNITIPNSVTTIGSSAFALCSNLTTLTLGYGIREIGGSAFGNCNKLRCIYYYGDSEPKIGEGAFYNVFTSVITYPTYVGSKFGNLDVVSEFTEGICEPLPTHSFSQSNTFSNSNTYAQSDSRSFSELCSFSQSNTFSNSNTFTESLQSDISLSFSYTLTITLSITHSLTIYETKTKSFSLYINNSTFSYIETEFIYYSYTIVIYSTYCNYYSNFFTMFYSNDNNNNQNNDNKTTIIIISVCVIVIVIVIITLLIIFLKHIRNKKEEIYENDKSEQNENETTNTFTTGISNINIEEDPFAEDFQEEKFIEQI